MNRSGLGVLFHEFLRMLKKPVSSPDLSFPSYNSTAAAQAGYTAACKNNFWGSSSALPPRIKAEFLTSHWALHCRKHWKQPATSSTFAPAQSWAPAVAITSDSCCQDSFMYPLRQALAVTIYCFLTMSDVKGTLCWLFANWWKVSGKVVQLQYHPVHSNSWPMV